VINVLKTTSVSFIRSCSLYYHQTDTMSLFTSRNLSLF